MILFPNAKINIGLNVLSRRADGYHNLETVFYPIPLHDSIEVIEADHMSFNSSGIEIPGHANENLCLMAYDLLSKDFPLPALNIHLHKNIPIGAGLGGGSSDAAFFVKLLNEKFSLGLSLGQMQDYVRKLGADCAFFISNEPVFASGKGDQFTSINLDLSAYSIVLVMPPVHVSTGEAYRGVKPHTPEVSLLDLIKLPVSEWKGKVRNDFEDSIFKTHALIRGVKAALYEQGALYAAMSGSGSAVFGIFESRPDLKAFGEDFHVFFF